MAIVHLLLFKFKASASATQMADVCTAAFDLRTACVHPSTGAPYIMNATGGRNTSPEGLNDGLTHAFTFIFASEEDRAYYLDHDPAHQKFKAECAVWFEKVVVLDYEPSAF